MSHPKIPSAPNIRNAFKVNNQNSLMSTLDKKRQGQSKDKDKAKFINLLENGQQIQTKGSAQINFRSIKNTQKPTKEVIQHKGKPKQPLIQPSGVHKVPSNNQNLPLSRKPTVVEVVRDRSVSRKKREEDTDHQLRKTSRVTINNNDFDDFGCSEELVYKVEPKTEKKNISQGLTDKKVSDKSLKPPAKLPNSNLYDLQQQLLEFDAKCLEINTVAQTESVSFLDARNLCYMIDSQYIERRQKNLNWTMRAILMDWMMHISYEFRLKRETLHVALTLVDNFFQVTSNLPKADFQLTGAASLFIAAKLQQFEPLSSKQFAKSTKDRYSAQQIKLMETKICKCLKYNLNPATINMWANRIMQQWDLFLQGTTMLQQPFFRNHQPLFFKRVDEDSYNNYRQMMQILDCAILDIQTVQYKPKMLVCSLLYLVLGKQSNEFSKKKIVNEFPRTSLFFLQETDFNSMFRYFLEQSFGLQMYELLPSVQYLSTYFLLPLSYQRPCLRVDEEHEEEMHLQEYCSYQTYNPNMLVAVRKRYRGIYQ